MCSPCCVRFSRCLLVSFNFLFWLSGVTSVIICLVLILNGTMEFAVDIIDGVSNKITLITSLVLGLITFMIAFVGCCGALNESRQLLRIYVLVLLFMIGVEVAVSSFLFINRKPVNYMINKEINKLFMKYYGNDTHKTSQVDDIQQYFQCCGLTTYKDWQKSEWYIRLVDNITIVPNSCCDPMWSSCWLPNTGQMFTIGCIEKIKTYVKKFYPIILSVTCAILCLKICVVICAACIYFQKSRRKQREEAYFELIGR